MATERVHLERPTAEGVRTVTKIVELIEGGFVAQTLLVLIVWGAIAYLAVSARAIPDPLLDAGFVMVGFYFRSAVAQTSKSSCSK
jgi:hypothetical protein